MAWFVLQKTWMVATQYISVCPSTYQSSIYETHTICQVLS